MRAKGYILHETKQRVIIVTGCARKSKNTKTGPMLQIWILHRTISPIKAARLGHDKVVCGDCPHAGLKQIRFTKRGARIVSVLRKRSCYVNLRAPQAVWKAYRRGSYPRLTPAQYPRVFSGSRVRLGAYGDPAFMPPRMVRLICSIADKHTGYSHQWMRAEWLKPYVMASVDTCQEKETARALGWRTFRVSLPDGAPFDDEILCPASEQAGHKVQCFDCAMCHGFNSARPTLRSVTIPAHGSGASHAFTILQ